MAGGDDWTAWLNGTYTPAPTPIPTITVTAAPIIQERVVERVVSGGTEIVVREVLPPAPDLSSMKRVRAEIKRLKSEINKLERKLRKLKKQEK
jgi:hypothetical protein